MYYMFLLMKNTLYMYIGEIIMLPEKCWESLLDLDSNLC